MILTLLSLIIILTYVSVMIKRNGIPPSISETYYSLQHKLWFGFTMWSVGFMLLIVLLNMVPAAIQFIAFLACSGVLLVGAAPNFKEEFEHKVHVAGALLCIVGSQILITLMNPMLLLVWVLYLLYTIIMLKIKWSNNLKESFRLTKPLFWIEITAFTTIFLLCLI